MKSNKFTLRFTGKQIAHIYSLCRKELSEDSISVLLEIAPIIRKIDYMKVIPAFTQQEMKSFQDSLAFKNDMDSMNENENKKCKRAYEKWSQYPDSCNAQELKLVIDYLVLKEGGDIE